MLVYENNCIDKFRNLLNICFRLKYTIRHMICSTSANDIKDYFMKTVKKPKIAPSLVAKTASTQQRREVL